MMSISNKASENGESPVLCSACQHPFSFGQLGQLLFGSGYNEACRKCDKSTDLEHADVHPSSGQEELINTELAQRATWFHSSTRNNWLSDAKRSRALVHVGTRQAAIERAHTLTLGRSEGTTMYEVRLRAGVVLDDAVIADKTEGWNNSRGSSKVVAQRYLNRWESPGSISMIVDPRDLEVVRSYNFTGAQIEAEAPCYLTCEERMPA